MIYLNNNYFNTKKEKNKHLLLKDYKKIESEYNHYIFSKDKRIGMTNFKKALADMIGTTLSNIYKIIKDGLITVKDYDLRERIEFNANTAYEKRTKKSIESNSSKRLSSKTFVDLVVKELRSEYNINSVDEIINDLKLNRQDEIKDMETICTATFYNYVEQNKIDGFNKEELPMKTKRKKKNEHKEGKTAPKGTSIEERPFKLEDRSEFGHWEGDTIVGGRNVKNSGAVFTLVERKTRFQLTVKMKDRKANTVYKAVKLLKKKYPELNNYKLSDIFKTITFDNGVEFSKWKDIEKYLKTKTYFAHPYSSCERGSNENGNKLLRIFLPKGSNINEYDDDYIMRANELINTKIRKILGYKSSLELFTIELEKLTQLTA